jgi:hypothetical protein
MPFLLCTPSLFFYYLKIALKSIFSSRKFVNLKFVRQLGTTLCIFFYDSAALGNTECPRACRSLRMRSAETAITQPLLRFSLG